MVANTMVVSHEQLVGEACREHLCAVVLEAPMPHLLIQFEQRLEPLIERFHGLLASYIDAPPAATLQEGARFFERRSARRLLGGERGFQLPSLGIARVFGAQETPIRSSAVLVIFNPLAILIPVIAAVRGYRTCTSRQIVDLVREGSRLAGAGGVDRSQERKHRIARRSGDHDLVAVAMRPAVVFRIAPGAVAVYARGDFACLSILFMPRRTQSIDQTFVHGYLRRIRDAFGDAPLSVKFNGFAPQAMCLAVAPEIGRPRWKAFVSHPAGDGCPLLAQKAILGRFALFLVEYGNHNQGRHPPLRKGRLGTAPLARALTLGRLENGDGHPDQTLQALARLGLPSHAWDLPQLPCFVLGRKKHNRGGPMRLEQLNHETPSNSCLGTLVLETPFRSRAGT